MATLSITPNMGLPNPIPGAEPGQQYALDLQACFAIVDSHNHSPGFGVQITPNGLNLNADVTFLDNNAISLRATRFAPQSAPIPNTGLDIGELYVSGNELYYNDVTGGNQVQVTNNGSVNSGAGSISGLPSGTASAAFSAGTFTWQSATATAANMDFGSAILRNNTASSFGLTLQPPTLASNYSLTLPTVPVILSLLTIDTSGNIAPTYSTSNGMPASVLQNLSITTGLLANGAVTGAKIATGTIGGVNIANNTVTYDNLVASNANVTGNSSSTVTTSFTTVSSETVTTHGRPVLIFVQATAGQTSSMLASAAGVQVYQFSLSGAAGTVAVWQGSVSGTFISGIPPFCFLSQQAAGTYTYILQAKIASGTMLVSNVQLVAVEL